jgi:hypothetical protein
MSDEAEQCVLIARDEIANKVVIASSVLAAPGGSSPES